MNKYIKSIPEYPPLKEFDPASIPDVTKLEDAVHKNDPGEREATEDEIRNLDNQIRY